MLILVFFLHLEANLKQVSGITFSKSWSGGLFVFPSSVVRFEVCIDLSWEHLDRSLKHAWWGGAPLCLWLTGHEALSILGYYVRVGWSAWSIFAASERSVILNVITNMLYEHKTRFNPACENHPSQTEDS